MNDSFASAEENTVRGNCLFIEINGNATAEWKNDSIQFSPYCDFQAELSAIPSDFQINHPSQKKILSPVKIDQVISKEEIPINAQVITQFCPELNTSLILSQPTQIENIQTTLNQEASFEKENIKKLSSCLTITLNEETIPTKISEESDIYSEIENNLSSLRCFLQSHAKIYQPHLNNLKFLFKSLKEHGSNTFETLKMYIKFFEVKIKQQIQCLKTFDDYELDYSNAQDKRQYQFDEIYIDESVVISHFIHKNQEKKEKVLKFYQVIKQHYERLLTTYIKLKEKRQKKENNIEQEIISALDRVQRQLLEMIAYRLNKEHKINKDASEMQMKSEIKQKHSYILKDQYLELKYMILREQGYLSLMKTFNKKVINYLQAIFIKQQILINKVIKESLVDYGEAYLYCYDEDNKILPVQLDHLDQSDCQMLLKNQLQSLLLQKYLPKEFSKTILEQKSTQNMLLEDVVAHLNKYLQNMIFLTSIEMNNQCILFRNQAIWKNQKNYSLSTKQNNCQENKSSHSHIFSQRQQINICLQNSETDLKVVVVLTSNGFVHLQNEQKIATLKLNEIKISKKGRQIVINDKGKGLSGMFNIKKQLGVIQFSNIQQVNIFQSMLNKAIGKASLICV